MGTRASLSINTILARYSTPGLRKNQLDRSAKKLQLEALNFSRERVLDTLKELYPDEEPTQESQDQQTQTEG